MTHEKYPGTPAEIYERWLVPAFAMPCAAPVIEAAALDTGDRVIDVGCGTGAVARWAAQLVGPHGSVAAVDGHPGMLDVARASTPSGVTIDWRHASADGLPFADDSFDVATCSLSLQFFADKVRSLDEMRRVVVPGGRVAVGVPGPTPPLFEVLHDVLAEQLGADAAAIVHTVFSLHEPARLHLLMDDAGLSNIDSTNHTVSLRLGPPTDFLWQYLLGTPLAAHVARLDTSRRLALETAIAHRWEQFVEEGTIEATVDLVVGTANVQSG